MGLTKLGSNTVTLTGTNTFSGPTTVSGGALDLDNSNALQNSTLMATSGSVTFDSGVASKTFSFGGLSGSGNLTLLNTAGTAVALTVGGNNASTTYSGVLRPTGGSLTKVGAGSLLITGENTYTGLTTISAGTLQLGDGTSGDDGFSPTAAPSTTIPP